MSVEIQQKIVFELSFVDELNQLGPGEVFRYNFEELSERIRSKIPKFNGSAADKKLLLTTYLRACQQLGSPEPEWALETRMVLLDVAVTQLSAA